MICADCGRNLRVTKFSPSSTRNTFRNGRCSYCKECNNERVKRLLRARKLPVFSKEVRGWPDQKISNEIAWLMAKVEILRNELRHHRARHEVLQLIKGLDLKDKT